MAAGARSGTVRMDSGTPWKLMLSFAMPVLLGLLLQQLYNTVDIVIVGNYVSEKALAAVGATSCLTMFFLSIANGLSAGAGVLISLRFGAGDKEGLRRISSSSVSLLLILGLISTVAGIVLAPLVIGPVLGTPESIRDLAESYFVIYCLSLVFQFGYNIVSAVLRAVGDSRATLYFLLVASVLNIILDIVFVGYLDMGVEGAAAATGISQAACCASAFVYMNRRYEVFRYVPSSISLDRSIAKDVVRTGFPMALQQIIVSFGFVFLQAAVNSYGESMTASFTVGQRIEAYINLPAISLQITMATYSAQNIGAGRMDRISSGSKDAVKLSFLLTAAVSAAVFLLASPIVSAFGLSGTAADYCGAHLRTASVAMMIFASYFPLLGLFQGARDGFAATAVATVVLAVRVATTYTLCYIPALDYRMIWFNLFFGFAVGIAFTYSYYFSGRWKRNIPAYAGTPAA